LKYQEGNVSGDDVKGSKSPDARQIVPDGATTARPAGNGTGGEGHGQITWVGAQHLMQGYCGRMVAARRDARTGAARPLQRPRMLPLRIGPKPSARTAGASASAA